MFKFINDFIERNVSGVNKYYKIFAILRVLLTVLPQTGYIHPDEYFQSIEVVAEKVLQVQINKPWEFNASYPVRSISSMYLTVGFSHQILKAFDYFIYLLSGFTIIFPYTVVVCPRLVICALSFVVDWSLYNICLINNERYESRSLILSISYIMLTYATRTFSNAIELVLFALLLYYVSEGLIFSTTNIKKYQYLSYRYSLAVNPVEKAKFRKLQLFLENDTVRNWFVISTITVVGVFNRPTFIVYAMGPVFFWLYRGIGLRSVSSMAFYLRTGLFQIGLIPATLLNVIIDSFYFGYLTWGEIGVLQVALDNFVFTPWNFIKYNISASNLAKHGLHPRYLHAVVNIPLLFNVLTFFCYSNVAELIKYVLQAKYHYLPNVRSIKGLMIAAFIVPLLLLSYIPHQEPRFLIPLILPVVYLYGTKILPESDGVVVVKATKSKRHGGHKRDAQPYYLFRIWISINIFLTLFYGFLHQGGVYSFISHMNTEIKTSQNEYHIITSHTYSLPESLFLQKIERFAAGRKYTSAKQVVIHEQGSKSLSVVLTDTMHILRYCKNKNGPPCSVYLLLPGTLLDDFEYLNYKIHKNLSVKKVNCFYPHISMEMLPTLTAVLRADIKYCATLFSLVSIQVKLSSDTD